MNGAEPSAEPVRESAARFGTVKQAAAAYGVSERAIIKRIASGTLEATKDGKEWRVQLPEPGTEPSAEPVPNALEPLVKRLEGEVEFLRAELTATREASEQASGEFRRLLLSRDTEIARLTAENRKRLAAPVEDTPQPPQEAHTAQEAAGGDILTTTGDVPRKWWAKIFGRK